MLEAAGDRGKASRMPELPTGGMSVLTRSSVDTCRPVRACTYAPIVELIVIPVGLILLCSLPSPRRLESRWR